MRLHGSVRRRLAEIRDEVKKLREMVTVLEEQLAYQEGVVDEASTRATVAGTPLADRERRAAAEDLRRLQRQRDETVVRLDELSAEQDRLLDRLTAPDP